MKILQKLLLLAILASSSTPAIAALNVLACEPEWAALTKELGGKHVKVYSATTAFQDPHHIQARPSLISKARKADLLICSGAELEVGWLPVLLQKSGNPNIQNSAVGNIMATDHVELLGKLDKVSRSMGDVHGAGNPHIHLDPKRMLLVSKEVTARLKKIDPNNSETYKQNHLAFETKIAAMLERMQATIESLNGKRWVVHHNNWVYLNEWLGLDQVATLEPKPGVPPTTKHLASIVNTINSETVDVIAYGSYQPKKAANWLGKRTEITVLNMPYSVSKWDEENALVQWYESLLLKLSGS